ncbi:SIMPL domain-containing protein [Sapientia aquatica]|uniref:DUF541 domain-containing protein n=1 Tax=Sapientia aquatica TaxID=1549640 RepID=A0A4R5W0B8_9BURK|nr:SIMPL domain-containing protein [Sapientia aquatica]TDK65247.1 DUF541 domain-containing protein [Sapientia aquatica]
MIPTLVQRLLTPIVFIAFSCATNLSAASQLPDYPFIHVTGNADVYVQPDLGQISFEITTSSDQAEQATEQAAAINAEIVALLEQLQIPLTDLTIYAVQKKSRTMEAIDGKPARVIVEVKQGMQIDVHDLSKWELLTPPLLAKENLGNFDATFDYTKRKQAREDLIVEAINHAKQNGTIIAESFGRHLGAVAAVSSGRLMNLGAELNLVSNPYFDDAPRRENSIRNFSSPAAIKIVQSVDVIFKIK